MISEILLKCAEDLYGWYRSESLIRFDEAVTAEDDTAKAQLAQVYARLNDCMTYESQFCGCAYQTLPQYLAAQMPKEDVDCFFRRLLEEEIIQTPNHPAAAEDADDKTQRMCLEQLANHFIHWDALDLLNRVLADNEKKPEYSAITASKLLELGRRFQILFYGRNIPDLASFLLQYGYDDSSVRRLYARCADEDRRYRDVRPAQSLPEQAFFAKKGEKLEIHE